MLDLKDMSLPNFSGACLQLYFRAGDALDVTWIEEARFEMQAGRVFLTGRLMAEMLDDGVPCPTTITALAWDEVVQYYVYRDRASAIMFWDACREENNENPPRRGWFR